MKKQRQAVGQNSFSVAATEIHLLWRTIIMEKKKRGRPKVDASLTETVYRESRRQAVNRKYVFDGVGVLMDGGEQIPDNKLLYNLGESKEEFVSRNGILEQIGRMDQQDHASFDDCVYIANLAAAAVKAGAKSREIEKAIRAVRMAMKQAAPDPEATENLYRVGVAVKALKRLSENQV